MASNVYLILTDEKGKTLDGNSKAKGFVKAIEVVSWSHGFSQPTSAATKSSDQQAVSRANHADLSFTKFFDNSSDNILKACWTGQQIKTAVFQMFRASGSTDTGKSATEYLKIEMEDIIISNYSVSGGGDELPIENVTLNYSSVKYTFKEVDADKGTAGSAIPIKHDLATNEVS
ncbi:MAG: type VI secretion system tube protein Hcp [Gammaproteobacteria bacterium]|nr:type VI secretion system tube protein Hcp [Gammaproteobacteria bacterium]